MSSLTVFVVGVLFVGYALVAKRMTTTVVTGPMFFVAAGLLVGGAGLRAFEGGVGIEPITLLLELTLAVVLFGDAAAINSSDWRDDVTLSGRLLGIGLPLTIFAGIALAAVLLTDLDVWEAGMLGAILAPTDAALGQAVISNPRVPAFIRQGLNVESGLNDGISLPFILFFLSVGEGVAASRPLSSLLTLLSREILVAVAVGMLVGWIGGRLLVEAARRAWTTDMWLQIGAVGLAAAAYAAATALEGSGFIAVWLAGLMLGRGTRDSVESIGGFAETIGAALTMLSFLVFGAVIVVPTIHDLTWQIVGYAIASLTVVRMIPVAVSLLGTDLRPPSVLFLGWFGPRGLASIVIAGLVVESATLPHRDLVVTTAMLTVMISVVVHGVTAWWGSQRYADWWEAHPADTAVTERRGPVRVPRRFRAPGISPSPGEAGAARDA